MPKIEGSGSGSISQRHGSPDPDPDPPQKSWIRNTGCMYLSCNKPWHICTVDKVCAFICFMVCVVRHKTQNCINQRKDIYIEHRAGKATRLASWRKMTQPGAFSPDSLHRKYSSYRHELNHTPLAGVSGVWYILNKICRSYWISCLHWMHFLDCTRHMYSIYLVCMHCLWCTHTACLACSFCHAQWDLPDDGCVRGRPFPPSLQLLNRLSKVNTSCGGMPGRSSVLKKWGAAGWGE